MFWCFNLSWLKLVGQFLLWMGEYKEMNLDKNGHLNVNSLDPDFDLVCTF